MHCKCNSFVVLKLRKHCKHTLPAQTASHILGCAWSRAACREREGILLLYLTASLRPHLQYWGWLWGLQHRKDLDLQGQRTLTSLEAQTPENPGQGHKDDHRAGASPLKTSWESQGCSAWKRERFGVPWVQLSSSWREATKNLERDFLQWHVVRKRGWEWNQTERG